MNDKRVNDLDPYVIAGSQVLANKLNITDSKRLAEAEIAFSRLRASTIELAAPTMGLPRLCAIHRTLFQDIFDWAGELRLVDISQDDTGYCHFAYLEKEGNAVMQRLEDEEYLLGLTLEQICPRLAEYYADIHMLHPFREGNGRAQRIFFEQLVMHAGFDISWQGIDRQAWLEANRAGALGDLSLLTDIFRQAVREPQPRDA